MKGKKEFTSNEVEAIKKLITEKLHSSPDKQKGIRNKIRNIGFYYSDFSSQKDGYTVSDFEHLIRTGQVTVIGNHSILSQKSVTLENEVIIKPSSNNTNSDLSPIDLKSILTDLGKNKFDPTVDNDFEIPDMPGNYVICLRSGSKLPQVTFSPYLTSLENKEVIYTGIAGVSLRNRDYKQHFKGNNAGRSTLRKSLGVLFGYKLIPRDSDPSTGKTKFDDLDEKTLTEWMCKNLILHYYVTPAFNKVELELINHFNPPLNLKENNNMINLEFRRLLSSLRNTK